MQKDSLRGECAGGESEDCAVAESLRGACAVGVWGEGGGLVCGFAINITFRKKFLLVLYTMEVHHRDR